MRIGLTGGIAAGKTTVARELERLGAVIVDADVLARQVVAPGSAGLAAVVARFGDDILAVDGSMNRAAVARIVFGDAAARADLNAIIHPLVRSLAAEAEAVAPDGSIVVHVIPLLVETGQQGRFDAVIVVDLPVPEQLARLMRRDGLTRDEAEQRVAAQASREERLRAATHVIDASRPLPEMLQQVRALWDWLQGSNELREISDRSRTTPSRTE
ncbi:MAG: dephospho-CoA kinase [Propionibacteriaceae bacterium]|nr:dephospho-CoA kinase [Propionibacteriaceae bacterium]